MVLVAVIMRHRALDVDHRQQAKHERLHNRNKHTEQQKRHGHQEWNQRKKRRCDQDYSNRIEMVPTLSLFSPIAGKLAEIPCFHPVADGERTDDRPGLTTDARDTGGHSSLVGPWSAPIPFESVSINWSIPHTPISK